VSTEVSPTDVAALLGADPRGTHGTDGTDGLADAPPHRPGALSTAGAPSVAPSEASEVVYDASAITVLEGLEAVRKRPGMYIGSTGERGLHHLVQEVVDNSVDEALQGHCDHIDITLLPGGGVRVRDDGRGIPVDEQQSEHLPAVTVVLTVLHAGGKFGGGGYKVSGGLHGVGVSVVNALSRRLDVEVRRDGHHWRQSFALGDPTGPLVRGEPTDDHGTTITFWPSADIFETTVYSFDALAVRFREMAFLNKGLELSLTDERGPEDLVEHGDAADSAVDASTAAELAGRHAAGELVPADADLADTVTVGADPRTAGVSADADPEGDGRVREVSYRFDGGLVDYVHHLNSSPNRTPIHKSVIALESETTDAGLSLEIAMQWNASYTESVHTFANTINTVEGGTHEEGFRAALTTTVNKFAEDQGLVKKPADRLAGEDIREGLTAIVSIKLTDPQFEGQTKTKLGNTEAKGYVQTTLYERLTHWFGEHPQEGRDIVKKSISASQARLAAKKARELARSRKSLFGGGGLPGKLADCQSRNPDECEVFIVEGDSAGGPAKQGRNPKIQAILPIRGKILNVEKARIDRVLGNQEVQAIISALGTGVQDDFDLDKLRYHKIVLMADADVDGQHIRTLLLTLLFRFMRPLVEHGFVYLAQPPLYRLKWTQGAHDYVYSDNERDALVRHGLAAGRKLPKEGGIQRYKGLGEMNDDELWETTMNPESRTLLQVTLEDAARADEMFSILMGEDVEQRRSFIQRNAKDVRFLDI